jgi:hypothetical protein
MNQLGLAVDLSHAGDRTAMDTCDQSERPVFITHAGAREVWDIPRMKPDDVLRAVAETGGVIGMSAAPHTTLSAAHPRHSIESVMDHFQYCADLVGIEHVAFGPDTLYGDHVALHRIFAHLLSMRAARGPAFDPVAYVDGLENPTENFGNICAWLVQHGYVDDDIRAVLGGNIYRALQSIWVLWPLEGQLDPDREPLVPSAGQDQRRVAGEVEHAGEHPLQLPLGRVHRRGGHRRGERGGRGGQHVDAAVDLGGARQQVIALAQGGPVGIAGYGRGGPEQPEGVRPVALGVAFHLSAVHLPGLEQDNFTERNGDLAQDGCVHVYRGKRPG